MIEGMVLIMTDNEKLDLILYRLDDIETLLSSMHHCLCIIRIREDTVYMEQQLIHQKLDKLYRPRRR